MNMKPVKDDIILRIKNQNLPFNNDAHCVTNPSAKEIIMSFEMQSPSTISIKIS